MSAQVGSIRFEDRLNFCVWKCVNYENEIAGIKFFVDPDSFSVAGMGRSVMASAQILFNL